MTRGLEQHAGCSIAGSAVVANHTNSLIQELGSTRPPQRTFSASTIIVIHSSYVNVGVLLLDLCGNECRRHENDVIGAVRFDNSHCHHLAFDNNELSLSMDSSPSPPQHNWS